MHQLEEEVDSQVKEVEVRVQQKAKQEVEAERQSLRELMKGEMEELQTHLSMFEKVMQLLYCRWDSMRLKETQWDSMSQTLISLSQNYS